MNWVDLLIILIFIIYVYDGYRRGFLKLTWELFSLVLAFIFSLKFYSSLSYMLNHSLHLSILNARSSAFILIWIFIQILFYIIGHLIIIYAPQLTKESKINHRLGLIPAAIKGIIFIAVLLILFIIIPINISIKNSINNSLIAEMLINALAKTENQISNVFNPNDNSLTSLTRVQPEKDSALNFSTTDISIDEIGEDVLLSKTNDERKKANIAPLKNDNLIKNVARGQSSDMAIRGYFSHNSPTGQGLLRRLVEAHVSFTTAAENIALAPTIDLAQIGLINSPEHRANILDPTFTRVGIGVIRANNHGLLVTEDFAK